MPDAEFHAISCPYCQIGHAEIVVERPGGEVQVRDFNEPRKCGTCHRFFRLTYRVQIMGERLEGDNGKVRVL